MDTNFNHAIEATNSPAAVYRSVAKNESPLRSAHFSTDPGLKMSQLPSVQWVAKSAIINRWATDAGFIIGDGPASQNLLAINVGKLGAFVWNNVDLSDGAKMHEVDVGINYQVIDTKIASHSLSLTMGAQGWFYPSELLSSQSRFDVLATATVTWSGPIRIAADFKHLFEGQSTDFSGDLLVLKAARDHKLYEFGNDSKLTLSVETQLPLRKDFFVKDGLSTPCVRPGVSLQWQDKSQKWALELLGRYQIGIDAKTSDQAVFGFSVQRVW